MNLENGIMSADFMMRYEKVVLAVHKHSRWLSWFGLAYMIFSILLFIVKGFQMWRILTMNEISHGNNNKTQAL